MHHKLIFVLHINYLIYKNTEQFYFYFQNSVGHDIWKRYIGKLFLDSRVVKCIMPKIKMDP